MDIISDEENDLQTFSDLSYKEFFVVLPLLILTLYLGLFPQYLFSQLSDLVYLLLENYSI